MTTVDDDDRRQIAGEREPADPTEAGRRRPLVLVVAASDPAPYAGLLWYNGYDVCHAVDVDDAVAVVLEHGPDLLLLDDGEADNPMGRELVQLIRGGDLAVPVVALVGQSTDLGMAAPEAGSVAVVRKPASPFAVVRAVMRLIGAPPRSGEVS